MKKPLKWIGIGFIVVVLGSFAGGYWFVHSSIPTYKGTIEGLGLDGEVRILRDEWGIPHIYASSLEDVFFAQGYAQAEDRLFEMDLSRRAVRGRLSEILGESMIDSDKFLLTLGFYRAAEASEPILSEEGRTYLQRYADGINAYIERHKDRLPLEFTLLGYIPDKWLITDSLAIGKYMSWVLGDNMQTELLFMAISDKVGEEKLKEIFPKYPDGGITIMKEAWRQAGGSAELAQEALALVNLTERGKLGIPGVGIGSNNWVVSGSMTKSGYPILANDMHLEIKAPSIWYQNHLKVPGKLNVTGVIFPGVPGVIVGHNEHIAWGVTNLGPDVQDLYIEKRNPENPYQFEYQGKWEDATVIPYEIPVKGGEPVRYEVLITRHGPIITEVFDQDIPLALQWTNYLPTAELNAAIGFDRAINWDEFKKALDDFKVPAQNFVYADREGNIAYRGNGLIPIRTKGDGLLPVPGWTGEYEWDGFIPYEELPMMLNPEQGFIVTANNKVIDDSYPYFISHQWAPPYRAQVIYENLIGKTNLTLEDVLSIQNNWQNLLARTHAPIITDALNSGEWSGNEIKAKEMLMDWLSENPQDLPEQAGPAIFHTLYLSILKNTFADELGEELFKEFLSNGDAYNTMDRFLLSDSNWFDNVQTEQREDRVQVIQQAFRDAVSKLEQELGADPSRWQWGKLHTITFDHPVGSQEVLSWFFNRGPFPTGGSSITAGAASYPLNNPFAVTSSAPWRFGVDLGETDRGLDILFGGSSGHPFSKHYNDQMEKWLDGEYKTMWFADADVEKAAGNRITYLKP